MSDVGGRRTARGGGGSVLGLDAMDEDPLVLTVELLDPRRELVEEVHQVGVVVGAGVEETERVVLDVGGHVVGAHAAQGDDRVDTFVHGTFQVEDGAEDDVAQCHGPMADPERVAVVPQQ